MDKKDRHLRLSDPEEETFVTASGQRLRKSPIRNPVETVKSEMQEDIRKAKKVQKLLDDLEDLRIAAKRDRRIRIVSYGFTASMMLLSIAGVVALSVASAHGYDAGDASGFISIIPFIFAIVGVAFIVVMESDVLQDGGHAQDLRKKEREYRDYMNYEM